MKIAVLASGGVDSSVVLKLLQQQGHDVTAFYLKIWLEDELSFLGDCPWEEDLTYLREICATNKIPLEIIPLQKEYFEEVVSYALGEIKTGRTPNSDLMCNSKVKFGKFYERISDEYELVASGHYADKEILDGIHYLKKAKDSFKDQTYFLAHLNQKQLQRAIFPLGPYLKSEVRALAQQFNLPNQSRKDSQGVCFLGKIKYSDFVKYHLGEQPGDLINSDTGEKVGEHKGFWFYTIGQRKGIELSGGPWYVVRKDIPTNTVYISNNYHEEKKHRDNFDVENLHWICASPTPDQLKNLQVKIRHGENLYDCTLSRFLATSPNGLLHPPTEPVLLNTTAHVQITGTDQGLAAGQFAVFYSQNHCLGAGTIR
jgi:tRNA-specific 2-thiouridylase